jgi:hypothetical protein
MKTSLFWVVNFYRLHGASTQKTTIFKNFFSVQTCQNGTLILLSQMDERDRKESGGRIVRGTTFKLGGGGGGGSQVLPARPSGKCRLKRK